MIWFCPSKHLIVEALLAVILKFFGFTFILQIKVENFCYRHHGKSNHIDKLSVWNECYIIALWFKHFKLTNNYITFFYSPPPPPPLFCRTDGGDFSEMPLLFHRTDGGVFFSEMSTPFVYHLLLAIWFCSSKYLTSAWF